MALSAGRMLAAACLFGAIGPARGVGAAIITAAANIGCMNLHLQEISTRVASGSLAVLICGGAGLYQTALRMTVVHSTVVARTSRTSPAMTVTDVATEGSISRRSG